ncbi:MAG: FAD-dependent oxidoreductase, partial [Trueperaceae bacterium]|nr:FAD-dependent oxidoreductase [Trueperaceae bacterium]
MSRAHVAVVGAGFAGLAAAIDLALGGARVTLLEREPEVGGKAGEWRAEGFRFDVGPSVFTLPDVVDALFRDAGRERPFELRPLDPLCRYVYPSGRVWDVSSDLERTLAGLDADEGRAYRRALEAARRLYEDAAPTFVRGPAPGLARLAAYGLRAGWRARPGATLPQLLASLGVRGDLLPFFLRFATYFGGDPYRAPAVLHNIAWVELGQGVTLPVGGVHGVVRALRALATDLGVEVRTGVAVAALPVRGGRVREVVTDAGPVAVDGVVAAVDRRWALAWSGRPAPERRHPSLSGTVALLGVRGTTPALAAHTILFPPDYAAEFDDLREGRHPRDPTLYVHASVRGDP